MDARQEIHLAGHCPDQAAMLTSETAPALLVPDSSQPLTVGRLRRAGDLLLDSGRVAHYHLERQQLDRILSDLDLHREDRETPWQRFVAWLDERLPSLEHLRPALLDRALDSVFGDHQGWRWLGLALLLGLVVLLLWLLARILTNVLPALAGFPFGGTPRSAAGSALGTENTLDAIRRLSPDNQPAALLVHCIASLTQSGMLPARRGLTNGDCRKLLVRQSAEQGDAFRRLSELVERSVYGGQTLAGDELEACFSATARLTGEGAR